MSAFLLAQCGVIQFQPHGSMSTVLNSPRALALAEPPPLPQQRLDKQGQDTAAGCRLLLAEGTPGRYLDRLKDMCYLAAHWQRPP
jgi:hypothetical protein